MSTDTDIKSFKAFTYVGLALDPIHVGTGGSRLGRVDNTIVRDPVTRIPKIPGSSLAGVMRAYTAMAKGKYPHCAGLGQQNADGNSGHCSQPNCPVCTVFGFAKGRDSAGGFAGLASFSDMHVLLFPVASRIGPQWITCPMALRQIYSTEVKLTDENAIYPKESNNINDINLGWLLLQVKSDLPEMQNISQKLENYGINKDIVKNLCIVSNKLFGHIVNSNLEVRTSVAINPSTGAAEEGALFTYEALPRGTVLTWEIICRNPKHFKINGAYITVSTPEEVKKVLDCAYTYLEHLGIGGMGTRGMGRLQVLHNQTNPENCNEQNGGEK
ncbi:MAG: type III-B CRISPR module RAMP protein Cmr4 [Candidatus Magnetoovum sp. WYHC-5]|nr:type III-B CRISPR module RAMP protein Cmr4 [Candidatus Magnetoovum sp. WYHC-5]